MTIKDDTLVLVRPHDRSQFPALVYAIRNSNGTGPTSIAVLPNGRQVHVSNLDSGTLTVLESLVDHRPRTLPARVTAPLSSVDRAVPRSSSCVGVMREGQLTAGERDSVDLDAVQPPR